MCSCSVESVCVAVQLKVCLVLFVRVVVFWKVIVIIQSIEYYFDW